MAANPGRQPTTYETRVYAACSAVPAGRVTTYGAIAAALGRAGSGSSTTPSSSSSARAVGQALRRNPYAPTVPCHRVIAAGARLGGFSGCAGDTPSTRKKVAMLKAEGVVFGGVGGLCDPGVVMGADELATRLQASLKIECAYERETTGAEQV